MDNKHIKVLLIEDNPGDARLIGETLAEVKGALFDLECANKLSTGLERLAAGDIDVILLDLSLPDSRTFDTFAKAQAQAPEVPIVVLTGLDDEELAVKAVRGGAQDYLVKGQVDSNLLARAMRYAIERKRMEEELRRYSEHLEELVEERTRQLKESQEQLLKSERLAAIGEVAAMVGHDLRNPLQAITNAVFVINNMGEVMSYLREKPSTPPFNRERLSKELTQLREMIDVIDDSVRYANKVVSDLLDFAKIPKPDFQEVDLNSLIRDVLSTMKIPRNVTVTTQLDETLPRCKVDPTQMKRVYFNLVTNALQAIPEGGRLTIKSAKKGSIVEVQIMDTGVGIPPQNMKKVFNVLFTTKAKGAGLGLAVCKKLVEGHRGSIGVESEVGKGSIFTVKLPIRQEEGGKSK